MLRSRYLLLSLFSAMALGAACRLASEATGSNPRLVDGAVIVGGVTFRAETAVLESFPVQLRVRVIASNESAAPVRFTTGGCRVLLRAYRTPGHGGAPAWSQEHGAICIMDLELVRLQPGQSREYTTRASARQILGDSLPNGRYRLEAAFYKDGALVPLDAGEVDLAR